MPYKPYGLIAQGREKVNIYTEKTRKLFVKYYKFSSICS